MSKWIRRWQIDGSKGKVWVVSEDRNGDFGCSCPVWKFRRIQCHHIKAVQAGASKLRFAITGKATIVEMSNFTIPKYDADENVLYIPRSRILSSDEYADVARAMIEHGYTMEEFREMYCLGDHWTATYLFRLLG